MERQTYTQKVLDALRDDGHESLSFKDIECLTADELYQILPIAAVYGAWLDAVKAHALEVLGDEAAAIIKSAE